MRDIADRLVFVADGPSRVFIIGEERLALCDIICVTGNCGFRFKMSLVCNSMLTSKNKTVSYEAML